MVSSCQCHMLNVKHVNDFHFSFENMLQEIAVIIEILHICVLISENTFPATVLHNLWHFSKYKALIEIRHILV